RMARRSLSLCPIAQCKHLKHLWDGGCFHDERLPIRRPQGLAGDVVPDRSTLAKSACSARDYASRGCDAPWSVATRVRKVRGGTRSYDPRAATAGWGPFLH